MRHVLTVITAASLLALAPVQPAAQAATRGIRLATPGTTQPVTVDAVAGSGVFFSTDQSLLSSDTDAAVDVYRWSDGVLTLFSPGEGVDASFDAAVRDGAMVFATSALPRLGLFRMAGSGASHFNTTTGSADADAVFKAVSTDGNSVVFESAEDAIDTDSDSGAVDLFLDQFDPNSTSSIVNQVPLTVSTFADAHFVGGSADLLSVIYSTNEAVNPSDTNATTDLYGAGGVWGGPGFPPLLSDGKGGPDTFDAVKPNGAAIVFSSSDNNPGVGDNDGQPDVYLSEGLGADLLSAGSSAATYAGTTPGLEAVFYSTASQLDTADTDAAADIYTRSPDGPPALMTPDTPQAVHLDAVSATAQIVFDSAGRIYTIDDIGATVLLSGNGPSPVTFDARTDDGDVVFTSSDQLTPADTDDAADVYVNEAGVITLVSGGTNDLAATFAGSNADGSLIAFTTTEKLAAADTDAVSDIYTFGAVTLTPTPPDTTPPAGTTAAKSQKNDGTVEIKVTCSESCTALPSGKLTVPSVGARGKMTFKLTGAQVAIAPGAKGNVKLKVPKKAKKAAAAGIKAGKKVTVKITVVVSDAAGNKRTLKSSLKLK